MQIVDVMLTRKSIRNFSDREVPEGLVDEVVGFAGKRCPSAGGIRGYRALKTKLQLAYNAPLCLVICTDPELYVKRYGERGKSLYAIQDATIFATYITLLMVDRGLATIWVGAFRDGKIQRLVNTELRPVALLGVGYAESG